MGESDVCVSIRTQDISHSTQRTAWAQHTAHNIQYTTVHRRTEYVCLFFSLFSPQNASSAGLGLVQLAKLVFRMYLEKEDGEGDTVTLAWTY